MPLEMMMPGLMKLPMSKAGVYEVVTLDRDKSAFRLKFMERGQFGQNSSREVTIEPEVAEQLLTMLSRELDDNIEA